MNASGQQGQKFLGPLALVLSGGRRRAGIQAGLELKADTEERWSPPTRREESGEIVLHCELETNWCHWLRADRSQLSGAGPRACAADAPPTPTTEALAKSLSACHGSVFQLKDFTLLSPLLVTALG